MASSSPPRLVLRRVWALITRDPRVSERAIMRELGISKNMTHRAIHILRDRYGYIDYPARHVRARRVIVPFYVEELT